MPAIPADSMMIERVGADGPCGPSETHWISEPAGLTQFGAFIELLPPGSRSSLRHWHSAEDEMVFVLEGEVTLHEGEEATILRAGDAAAFRAGHPVGHYLENAGVATARYLVVGTRAPTDVITYPEHDRRCVRVRSLADDLWIDGDGAPAGSPYRG